jgi:hypothetical protein
MLATTPAHAHATTPDTTTPTLILASGTVDGPITLVFDEPILIGSGSVVLVNGTLTPIDGFDLSRVSATVNGNTLTFVPDHVLQPRAYGLAFYANSVRDLAGNPAADFASVALTLSTLKNGDSALPAYGQISRVDGSTANTHDTVIFDGAQSAYGFARTSSGYTVTRANGGTLELGSVERALFTGSHDKLALSFDGNLGQVYRLYQAAFDRTPDKIGFGFWVGVSDAGHSLREIAQNFISSKEFGDLYGHDVSNAAFVDALYHNVLHRNGDSGGIEYWNRRLEEGAERVDILTSFSESAENTAQVATLIGNGFTYTPYG